MHIGKITLLFAILAVVLISGCSSPTGQITEKTDTTVSQQSQCTPSWQCYGWSECIGNKHSRLCNDGCGNNNIENQDCICTSNWKCDEWSNCLNNRQSRLCNDGCGQSRNEAQDCVSCVSNWKCYDWSYCADSKQSRTCTNGCGQSRDESQNCNSCIPNWQCSSWSTCSTSGGQTRTCVDNNNCRDISEKPNEVQSCTPPPKTVETADSTYSANGLKFDVKMEEKGDSVSYINNIGRASEGKKVLKFKITVTSLDGDNSFYATSFILIDREGNTYDAQCPIFYINSFTGCTLQEYLGSMYSPIEGEKKSGILFYQIPKELDSADLVYKFSSYDSSPEVLKFVFNGI